MKNRVCILTTVHDYNDNRVFYKETLSLSSFGYEVFYIAPNASKVNNKEINCVDLIPEKRAIIRLLKSFQVFQLAKSLKCDVYHFQDSELIIVGLLLKAFTKAKVIYDVHEDYPSQMLTKFYLKEWMRKPLYHIMRSLEKICNKYLDAIITADNFVANHFSPTKTTIVYNYPNVELLNRALKNVPCEKKWDVIFPGSMSKFTADMILKIVKEVKERGYDIKCAIISPFNFEGGIDWVRKRVLELKMKHDDFLIMKNIPPYEVPFYITSSRIGLVPLPDTAKMRSNIPTKIFEYMYYNLPVITGDLPPSRQYILRSNSGFLVNPNSANDYADKIIYLLKHPDILEEMGQNGHNLVVEECNWANEERKLEKIYIKLLNK